MADALDLIRRHLRVAGLPAEMATELWERLLNGEPPEAVKRQIIEAIPGNVERMRKGLRPLQALEYGQLRETYRSVLASFGFPSGFYDTDEDIRAYIEQDVSPRELKARVERRVSEIEGRVPLVRDELRAQGIEVNEGTLLAYAIDQRRGADLVAREVEAVNRIRSLQPPAPPPVATPSMTDPLTWPYGTTHAERDDMRDVVEPELQVQATRTAAEKPDTVTAE